MGRRGVRLSQPAPSLRYPDQSSPLPESDTGEQPPGGLIIELPEVDFGNSTNQRLARPLQKHTAADHSEGQNSIEGDSIGRV